MRLSDVLEELHANGKCPPSVSHWTSLSHDIIIRKRFRMIRRLVGTDEFAVNYFWNGVTDLRKEWLELPEVQHILSYADSTSDINFSERTLFLPEGGDTAEYTTRLYRSYIIKEVANGLSPNQELQNVQSRFRKIALHMIVGLRKWCELLSQIVAKKQAEVKENAYQLLFSKYLEMFSIDCVPGDFIKLGIPYKDGEQVSCVPDMLLSVGHISSRYCGVVEVKRMAVDPEFKHAFTESPSQGILRIKTEGPSPEKRRRCVEDSETDSPKSIEKRVQFVGDHEESSDSEICDSEANVDVDDIETQMVGTELPESQRNLIRTLFSQLFGSVLALEFHQKPNKDKNQRLAIGVVGFRVIFFAFTVQETSTFEEVPEKQESKTLVYMTRPLSMLVASDRKEINKIALQMAARPSQ